MMDDFMGTIQKEASKAKPPTAAQLQAQVRKLTKEKGELQERLAATEDLQQDLAQRHAVANGRGQGGVVGQLDALVRGGEVRPDPARAAAAGDAYLSQAGLSGTVSVSGTVVTVNVNGTYECVFLSIIGLRTLPVSGTASADAVRAYQGAPR